MLVALAVMAIVLALVGHVFSITTQTAASASKLAEVQAVADTLLAQLEADLEGCDPERSLLVIFGRTQLAGRTEADRRARLAWRVLVGDPLAVPGGFNPRTTVPLPPNSQYSDPRADILMFFTYRPNASQAPPRATGSLSDDFQRALRQGTKVAPVQVVYGHASFGKAVPDAGASGFTLTPPEPDDHIQTEAPRQQFSRFPVTRWHLSRRALVIEDGLPASSAIPASLQPAIRPAVFRRILTLISDDPDIAGDSLRIEDFSSNMTWSLARRLLNPNPSFQAALASPYRFDHDGDWPQPAGWSPDNLWSDLPQWIHGLLYKGGDQQFHHVATIVEQPPVELADNLGLHLAAGCAWFQVELLLPEDPRNSRDYPLPDQRIDMPRWVEVPAGQTYVFVPDTPENRALVRAQVDAQGRPVGAPNPPLGSPGYRLNSFAQVIPPSTAPPPYNVYNGPNTVDNRMVRLWPYAIRITVRIFDREGRLEDPIVRSLVHRFE